MHYAGPMIITGIKGTTLNDDEKSFIEKEKIGGVILFSRNYESPSQIAMLVNSIQALRDEYPLFISVDHEGGRVMRFKNHFTQFPPMLQIAKKNSPKLCFEVFNIMSAELNACGINLSYAPVCDVIEMNTDENTIIGDRSFGSDPEEVSKFVSAAVRGLQANNIIACAKHFPGHGITTVDSHLQLPVIDASLDELKQREFIPFKKAVKSRVEFVMMAHLLVKSIDESLPTSLSANAYDLLRKELKFSKIIVSDAMEMKAIANKFKIEDSAVMAINAGSDMLIYGNIDEAKIATATINDALKTKKIKSTNYQQKIERIMDCKKRYFSNYNPIYIPTVTDGFKPHNSKTILDQLLLK
ncbi:MAG: beta-N-acetylhexosaminidase [Oligoflexia bacterium]|nr:beta-N-acetylhexosaminidase [Oligoflexia bacterium]